MDFLYKNNIFKLYNNSITFALTILFISSISIYLFNMDTSIKTNSKNIIVYENKNVKTKKIIFSIKISIYLNMLNIKL